MSRAIRNIKNEIEGAIRWGKCDTRPMTEEEKKKYANLKPPKRDTYERAVKKSRYNQIETEVIGGMEVIPMGLMR